MNYYLLTNKTLLTDVEIRQWHGEEYRVLENFGSLTVSELFSKLQTAGELEKAIYDEFTRNFSCDITLDYKVNEREYYIPLANNTSDVTDEEYCVSLNSELLFDSIMLCNSFVNLTLEKLLNSKMQLSICEYYSKFAAKEILSTALIDRLGEDHFKLSSYKHDYDINSDIGKKCVNEQLVCLPASNLRTLLNNYITIKYECGCEKYVSVFLSVAAKSGLLKFKPFISKDKNGNYSLVLKYNRFVHLFRGMYFQCSYTEDGKGTYSTSSIRLDAIYQLFHKYGLQDCKLVKYLYYMNLINCCREIDAFNNLLEIDSELIDKFMELSTRHLFKSYDVRYIDNIVNDVVYFVGYGIYRGRGPGFLEEPKEIYRIPKSDTSDYARVNIYYPHTIGIEVWEQEAMNEVLFILPGIFETGMDIEGLADNYGITAVEFEKEVTDAIYNSYEVRCTLAAFALNFSGFITNFLVTYPTAARKESKLRALNRPDIPEFKNLGVLYNK